MKYKCCFFPKAGIYVDRKRKQRLKRLTEEHALAEPLHRLDLRRRIGTQTKHKCQQREDMNSFVTWRVLGRFRQ